MLKRSRLLATQNRRQFLETLGMGLIAASITPANAQAPVTKPDTQHEEQPPAFEPRMRRLDYRPQSPATSILDQRRTPAIVVMDDEGNYIYGRYDFSGGPYSVPAAGISRTETDAEKIAAQYQFTASTTKVIALLAAAEWIKEQAAAGPNPHDAMPVDPLLDTRLQPYARVLGRTVSLAPRINTGGIMFHRHIDPQGSIDDLSIDQVLLLSQLYSTNDLLAYLNRHMGGTLDDRMAALCERYNMTDSRFVTVHGMASANERRQRIDCRSTAAEMIHALRVLDNLYPEFACYIGQVAYRPANTQLLALADNGELRPATQYIEGPARVGAHVTRVAARTPVEPYLDDTGRDLNAAYDPRAEVADVPPGDSAQAGGGDDETDVTPDTEVEDSGPLDGYPGVRLMKTGQLGQERNRRGRWLRRSRRTSWRTSLGKATRTINGAPRSIYFWTSSDASDQRKAAIEEALREGFGILEARSQLARAAVPVPADPRAAPQQPSAF